MKKTLLLQHGKKTVEIIRRLALSFIAIALISILLFILTGNTEVLPQAFGALFMSIVVVVVFNSNKECLEYSPDDRIFFLKKLGVSFKPEAPSLSLYKEKDSRYQNIKTYLGVVMTRENYKKVIDLISSNGEFTSSMSSYRIYPDEENERDVFLYMIRNLFEKNDQDAFYEANQIANELGLNLSSSIVQPNHAYAIKYIKGIKHKL